MDVTTLISAFAIELTVKSVKIIVEIIVRVFFIKCYNITACYNITFAIARDYLDEQRNIN
tara:strand:- start:397 stop:576 length:180 start_codon:yes stop_codon:yes gene_type:complete